MAFDESLVTRVRAAVSCRSGIREKRMFGSLCFLLYGNLLVGVWKNSLIVRLDAAQAEQASSDPHVRPMDLTGKPMKGWILVEADGLNDEAAVRQWVDRAWQVVSQLPGK